MLVNKDLTLLKHIMEVKRFMVRDVLDPKGVNMTSLNNISKILYEWLCQGDISPKLRQEMKEIAFSFVSEYNLRATTLYRGVKVDKDTSEEAILSHLTKQDMVSFSRDWEVAENFAGEANRFGTSPLQENEIGAVIKLRTASVQAFNLYDFLDQYLAKFGDKIPSTLAEKIDTLRFEQEVLLFAKAINPSNFEINSYTEID